MDTKEKVAPTASGPNQPTTSRRIPSLHANESSLLGEEIPMDPEKLIRSGAEQIISLFVPISICMFTVAIVAKQVPYFAGSNVFFVYTPFYTPNADVGTQVWQTLANVGIFLGVIVFMTFMLVLLFKFKCYKCLNVWLILTSFILLFFVSFIFFTETLRTVLHFFDTITFFVLLWNVGMMGLIAIHWQSPLILQQGYLIFNSCLVALTFLKYLPKWTCWVLLGALAIWDLIAVLCPRGPLRMLVNIAKERNQPLLPAMIYSTTSAYMTATPNGETTHDPLVFRDNQLSDLSRPLSPHDEQENFIQEPTTSMNDSGNRNSASKPSDSGGQPQNNFRSYNYISIEPPGNNAAPDGTIAPPLVTSHTNPLVQELTAPRGDEHAVDNPQNLRTVLEDRKKGGIKLGLGDFIFYSLLIGRAALDGDLLTIVSCYVAILMGICMTLVALFFDKGPLPALPISIVCGIIFYFCTSLVITPFIQRTSEQRLFF